MASRPKPTSPTLSPKSDTPDAHVPSATWTPGPWFRSGVRQKVGGADSHSVVATVDGKQLIIASVWYNPRTHEGFHDARLIAAAPTMAAALEEIIRATHAEKGWLGRHINSIAFAALGSTASPGSACEAAPDVATAPGGQKPDFDKDC